MATKKSAKPKSNGRHVDNEAMVRMYRHGLGDCLLVTLPKADGSPFYLMIDCGVVLGTPEPQPKMRKVVQSIIDATGGHVDVLVATHEHWDHLSGFLQAQDLFALAKDGDTAGKLKIGHLWLAWTEDPKNKLGVKLRAERQQKLDALRGTVQRLNGISGAMGVDPFPLSQGIDELLGFFGAAGSKTTRDALDLIRKFTDDPPRYCHPGEPPITLPDVPDFRIFVLGPPENEAFLKKTDSSTEVYKDDQGLAASPEWSLGAALTGDTALPQDTPFDRNDSIELTALKAPAESNSEGNPTIQFFDRYYYGKDTDSPYSDQRWRRIDADWLNAGSEFALALDSATNNTSLVLAIEHVPTGKVLLMAADAQVGNWLSWQDVSWKLDGQTVTGPDLLKRTVLYKVGHHGSHNATLRAKGLETMVSDDLVAVIPVNHEMAVKKRWGHMPLKRLVEALRQQTKGRVLQADQDFDEGQIEPEVRAAFKKSVHADPLYFEVTIPLDA